MKLRQLHSTAQSSTVQMGHLDRSDNERPLVSYGTLQIHQRECTFDAWVMKMKEKAEHSRAGVGVDNALVILWGPVQEVTSSRDASKHLLCGLAKGLNGGVAQLPEQETLQSNEKKSSAAAS